MRYIPLLLSLGAANIAATTTLLKCNADNCFRAIRASAFPDRPGTADCISFFQNYVTSTVTATEFTTISDTTTVTTTVTTPVTAPAVPGDCKCKRDASVPPIPTYASACSGLVRYSSACACIGVTATAPPTTTTVTSTSTVLISADATATDTAFVMQLVDGRPGYYVTKKGNFAYVDADLSPDPPVQWFLQQDGTLRFDGGLPFGFGGVDIIAIAVVDIGQPLYTCQIDASQYITCNYPQTSDPAVFGLIPHEEGGFYFVLGKTEEAVVNYNDGEGEVVRVKAVPAPIPI